MYKWASIFLTFLMITGVILPVLVDGQVRSSASYQIERDSFNTGGGLGTSASYTLQDTIGDVATGRSTSTSYVLDGGYQQITEETYITISAPADLQMDSINGLIGGVSTSSTAWIVTTNSGAGYSLTIKASTTPALKSSLDAFDDYAPSGSNPDFDFLITSSEAAFGYSPSGTHILGLFKDNNTACNAGSNDTPLKCWQGLSTTPEVIAQSASSNHPTGTETTVYFRAESGSNRLITAGDYSASITVTGLAL